MQETVAARLTGVSRLFGEFAALRNVTHTFARGRAYLVTGENGAGKSTLLHILAGLSRPSAGKADRPLAGSTAYMAHDSMLYEELTAEENLRYFAAMYPPGATLAAADALAEVGLAGPPLLRPVGKYSQGMRQRVSLARALMSGSQLLLLDEPFSNLDRPGAELVVGLLARLRDAGRTIIFTTHQPELAQHLPDVRLRMHRGELTAA